MPGNYYQHNIFVGKVKKCGSFNVKNVVLTEQKSF